MYGLTKKAAGKKITELLYRFSIDYADKRFDSYSTGMKRKMSLVRALLNNPRILLIDELTQSLDYETAGDISSYIRKLADDKVTVIISDHNINVLEKLCRFFIFLKKGHMLAFDNIDNLRNRLEDPDADLTEIYELIKKNV